VNEQTTILDAPPAERATRTKRTALATAPQQDLAPSSPDRLIELAISKGADVATLEKLMDLEARWKAAQAKEAFDRAFSAFKAEAIVIVKDTVVTDGPLKGKSYAKLHTVVKSVTAALSRHGLTAKWKTTKDDKDWIEVTCILRHVQGYEESASMGGAPDVGPGRNALQARMSTVSYLERYTLLAITGLSTSDSDDDGAGGPQTASRRPAASPLPPELLQQAREAAMGGVSAYSSWWKSITKEQRILLAAEHDGLKACAAEADGEAA